MDIAFRATSEDSPGPVWATAFEQMWPAYRRWFLLEGDAARPDYLECRRAMRAHMPELEGLWNDLTDLAGGGDQAARMLSLWRPSPYAAGCSQAVWSRGESFLARNYDYHPEAFEARVTRTEWLAKPVLAMADCLWGVLDGINEAGLCVALAFAGRRTVGEGFGIPLLLRYALQTCSDVESAVEALSRVPTHMSYHVSLLDAAGNSGRLTLTPDRAPVWSRANATTNHGDRIEWPEHAKATRSVARCRALEDALAAPTATAQSFVQGFLQPPLFQREYERGFGTLYTAIYRPGDRTVELLWPGSSWRLALRAFEQGERVVSYD